MSKPGTTPRRKRRRNPLALILTLFIVVSGSLGMSMPGTAHLARIGGAAVANLTADTTTAYGPHVTTIKREMFGANIDLGGMSPAYTTSQPPITATRSLAEANFTLMRVFVEQPYIVTSAMDRTTDYHNYNWTNFDRMVTYFHSMGWEPMISLWQSADYNAPVGVVNRNTSAPVSSWEWGRVVAAMVRHANIDLHFHIKYWEIWNEPDLFENYANSMTPTQYIDLYAAAAPQMKRVDPSIMVGGPALSGHFGDRGLNTTWLMPLLSTQSVVPYLDFVSWHQYDNPTLLGPELDQTYQSLSTVKRPISVFSPSEYRPYEDVRNAQYIGAAGTGAYLIDAIQHGSSMAANWVSYSLGITDKTQWDVPFSDLIYTTTLQLVPQGYIYRLFDHTLNLIDSRVVATTSDSNGVLYLASTVRNGTGGTDVYSVIDNNQITDIIANQHVTFPAAGDWELQSYIVGNDRNHDGTGAGQNDQPYQSFMVSAPNKSANIRMHIPPYSVVGFHLTLRKKIPTPTPTKTVATFTPTHTPTRVPTHTPTATPTNAVHATPILTNTPTKTPSHTPTPTATDVPTGTTTHTPTGTATHTPTPTPIVTQFPIASDTPTTTPTSMPTNTPTNEPTDTSTSTPTDAPTTIPTDTPTNTPTTTPTITPQPTVILTQLPANTDTPTPTVTPTSTATTTPTATPTDTPTDTATNTPTYTITATPTDIPTDTPTATPTFTPTDTPTATPTDTPTAQPTDTVTDTPTDTPTDIPTDTPTSTPTDTPTDTPTATPTTPLVGI